MNDAPDEVRVEREPENDPSDSSDDGSEESSVEVLEHDLEQLISEREELRGLAQRVQADFENYKKRIIRQQTEHLERAAEALVEKLLPVLDTFDLALVHDEGFDQVLASLMGVLEKEGLERIQPDGEAFDPNEHDAVAHEPRDDDAHGAEVIEVMRPGYRWKGRVVRPAMVKVKG